LRHRARRRGFSTSRQGLFPSGEVDRNNDEILEGASPEQRPVVSANTNRFSAQELEESIELVERRLLASSDQGVGQRDQQLPGAVTVDIGVGSSAIAQCLLDPVRARLQEEPLVSGAPAGGGDGQADFEGHVEPRRTAGELNPTEVMEGISARRDQPEDAVQPLCRAWDLECRSRAKPEGAEAGDQRDEEFLVPGIVGDVEEDVLR